MSYSVNGLTCADAILVVSVGNVLSVTYRRSELPSFFPGQRVNRVGEGATLYSLYNIIRIVSICIAL